MFPITKDVAHCEKEVGKHGERPVVASFSQPKHVELKIGGVHGCLQSFEVSLIVLSFTLANRDKALSSKSAGHGLHRCCA